MIDSVCPPPRLLLGSSLLFWGAMTGRPVIGLVAALLVEAKSWIRIRWDFDESSYESAWQLSFVMTALAAVVIWLDESRYTAVLVLLTWMPPLLLPLQFVQSYGTKDSIRLGAFSFLAKRSRARNKRLGLKVDPIEFNFGNVLLVVTLLASSVGMEDLSYAFLPGMIVLCSWALLATKRVKLLSLLPVILVAGGIAVAGQVGLENLERWIQRMTGRSSDQFDPHSNSTLIGTTGTVNLSTDIIWRLKTDQGVAPPRLLRTATYMNFIGNSWRNQTLPFPSLNWETIDGATYHKLGDEEDRVESFNQLPKFTLRGGVRPNDPLPLPGHSSAVRGLGEQVELKKSKLGTVLIAPSDPIIEMDGYWDGETYLETPSIPDDPLRLTANERDVIKQLIGEIGLRDAPTLQAKLALLHSWFDENFNYTLDLTIQRSPGINRFKVDEPTALALFLTDVRSGHCEYFATAATLMLREIGIQSRYAVGFAVDEIDYDRGGYVIRGTHSHAWVRVWDADASEWIDFDPTPPNWLGSLPKSNTLGQKMKDWLKRVREDFYLWRTQPENEWWVMVAVGVIGFGLGSVVVVRLWRSKKDMSGGKASKGYVGPVIRTPLHSLERQALTLLGERPDAVTYAQWIQGLEEHLNAPSVLEEAIVLHQRQRFDPAVDSEDVSEDLQVLVDQMKDQLKQQASAT